MSNLIVRKRRTRQPQTAVEVNYAHPSARNLVFAWNGATRRNLTNKPGSHTSFGAGLNDSYRDLLGFAPNGAGSLSFTGTHTCTSNEITVLRVFRYISTASFTQWKVQYGVPFGSSLNVGAYLSGSNILSESGAVILGANEPINALFVVYSGSGSTSTFHLNHNADASVTSSATLSGTTPTVRLGANLNDPSAGISNGSAGHLVLIWNRALERAERLRILANPWALFRPRQIIVPYVAAGGGLPTLSNARGVNVTSTGFQPAVDYAY